MIKFLVVWSMVCDAGVRDRRYWTQFESSFIEVKAGQDIQRQAEKATPKTSCSNIAVYSITKIGEKQ